MAKPSSASLDQPRPVRTTRQTRSRSQSVEHAHTLRPSSSRSSQASQNSPAKKRGRPPKKSTNKTIVAPELSTVEEDEPEPVEMPKRRPASRISAAASMMSGTTAKTSFSQEEVEQMDQEVIVDVLPALLEASDQMLRLMIPAGSATSPETWKEIRRTGSRSSKLYQNRLATINVHKPNFGTQEYIQPRYVLKALLDQDMDDIPAAPWRPDSLILKINLTTMLKMLLIDCNIGDWTDENTLALERLHTAFPETIAGDHFSPQALEFYLYLSAYVAVADIRAFIESESDFSPNEVIDRLFYDEEGIFRQLESLGLADADDVDRMHGAEAVKQTVDDLKRPFMNSGAAGVVAGYSYLTSRYGWDALEEKALLFFQGRVAELDHQVAEAGGIAQILERLEVEVQRRVDEKNAELLRRRYAKPGSTPRNSLGGKNRVAALKKRENLVEKQASQPAALDEATATSGKDTQVRDFSDPSAVQPMPPAVIPQSSHQAPFISHGIQRQDPQKRRPRLIDAQPNAQRVLSIDEDERAARFPELEDTVRVQEPRSSAGGKRSREVEEEDEGGNGYPPNPTPDDGFQNDERDHSSANQRRREMTFALSRSQNLPSNQDSVIAGPSYNRPPSYPPAPVPAQRPSPPKRQRLNPGSSLPPPTQPMEADDDAELPASSRYERAKTLAKTNRAGAMLNAHKPQQTRHPWTAEEESALMDMIEEHGGTGVSWQVLKSYDAASETPKLVRRTAEDIRFKARNMKTVFLRAQSGLPENWEHVLLDKKAIDKLHSLGIPYRQQRVRNVGFED